MPTAAPPPGLLQTCRQALHTFLHTQPQPRFSIVHTSSTRTHPLPLRSTSSQTIAILDSSFNPPTRAHLSLATSILRPSSTSTSTSPNAKPKRYGAPRFYSPPQRLILLFSTHNADKAPTPAAFEHRLALMWLFADDAVDIFRSSGSSSSSSSLPRSDSQPSANAIEADIDIALTSEPFYSDKSAAIDASALYGASATHVHLVGHDTFLRILTPRYYAERGHAPPLSALSTFFERHGLRITLRPSNSSAGGEEREREKQEQIRTWCDLAEGELEKEGGKREWSSRVEVVDAEEGAAGVSSTKLRKAVDEGDWEGVGRLCTGRVAEWVRSEGLYTRDGGGGGGAEDMGGEGGMQGKM